VQGSFGSVEIDLPPCALHAFCAVAHAFGSRQGKHEQVFGSAQSTL